MIVSQLSEIKCHNLKYLNYLKCIILFKLYNAFKCRRAVMYNIVLYNKNKLPIHFLYFEILSYNPKLIFLSQNKPVS